MSRKCLWKRMPIDKILTQGCANLGSYVAVATTFWTVALIVCGPLVRSLPNVALLAPRILRWNICVEKEVPPRYLTEGTKRGIWCHGIRPHDHQATEFRSPTKHLFVTRASLPPRECLSFLNKINIFLYESIHFTSRSCKAKCSVWCI